MLRPFLKDSAFYGAVLVAGKLIGLLVLPVLTAALSPGQFAAADSSVFFVNFALPLVFAGVDSAVGRYYYEDPGATPNLLASGFLIGLPVCLAVTVVLYLAAGPIAGLYLDQPGAMRWLRLAILSLPPLYVIAFFSTVFKFEFRRGSYAVATLLNPACFSLLVAIDALRGHLTVDRYLEWYLIANIAFALVTLWLARGLIGWALPRRDHLRKLYSFGVPFMFVSVLGLLFGLTERAFINQYYPLAAAGAYLFAYRLLSATTILNRALQLSWGPFAMLNARRDKAGAAFNRILLSLAVVLNLLSAGIVLADELIISLLANPSYMDARAFLPYLLGANNLLILSSLTNLGINLAESTLTHVRNYAASWGVFVAAFFLLKDWNLLLSVPIALFLSRLVLFVVQSRDAARLERSIRFRWEPALAMTVATTLMLGIIRY